MIGRNKISQAEKLMRKIGKIIEYAGMSLEDTGPEQCALQICTTPQYAKKLMLLLMDTCAKKAAKERT